MKRDYVSTWPPFRQGQYQPPTPLPDKPVGSLAVLPRGHTMKKMKKTPATTKTADTISLRLHIYAIYDKLANDIVGGISGITLHKHEATAARFFNDMCTAQGSAIPNHPDDFEFIRLGYLEIHKNGGQFGSDTINIVPDIATALTGRQWYDATFPKEK